MDPSSPGIPGWFVALFILFIVVGVGMTIYKSSYSASMARKRGQDPSEAAMTTFLVGDVGMAATYLKGPDPAPVRGPGDATAEPVRSTEQRLAELDDLHRRGLLTDAEHAAQRARIIGDI